MELIEAFSDKPISTQHDIAEILEMLNKDAFMTQTDVRERLKVGASTASERMKLIKERLHAHVHFTPNFNKLPNHNPRCPDCKGQKTTMQIIVTPAGKRKVTGMYCEDCNEMKRRGQIQRTVIGMYEKSGGDNV